MYCVLDYCLLLYCSLHNWSFQCCLLFLLSPLTSLIRSLGVNEKPFTTQDCVEYFQTSRAAEDANNAGCVNEVWWEYMFFVQFCSVHLRIVHAHCATTLTLLLNLHTQDLTNNQISCAVECQGQRLASTLIVSIAVCAPRHKHADISVQSVQVLTALPHGAFSVFSSTCLRLHCHSPSLLPQNPSNPPTCMGCQD